MSNVVPDDPTRSFPLLQIGQLIVSVMAPFIVRGLDSITKKLRKRGVQTGVLPPSGRNDVDPDDYSHLERQQVWQAYWLSYLPGGTGPYWMHGEQSMWVTGNLVSGNVIASQHPRLHSPGGELRYEINAEIRDGKMAVTDSCNGDRSQFGVEFFPDVTRRKKVYVGIWAGLDNGDRAIAAPVILSETELSIDALYKAVVDSKIVTVIPPRLYDIYSGR